MSTDRNGLEVLSREESLRLLATQRLGRIGVTFGALPVILPVNFALLGDRIVIPTSPGSRLDAAARRAVVAFEADAFDDRSRAGWSVTVTGSADVIDGRDERDAWHALRAAAIGWTPADPSHLVGISTQLLSGRRLADNGRSALSGGPSVV